MATTPTNNPVPSESPRDLKFNAGKIDEFVTSMVNTYTDRLGGEHYTIKGLENLVRQIIDPLGWVPFGTFEAGATLTDATQTLKYEADGNYYRWDGDFPKLVDADSTPDSTGGVAQGAWVNVTDLTLRASLASDHGFGNIGGATYAQIRSYSGSLPRVYCLGREHIFDGGNGFFEVDATDTTSIDNDGTILVDAVGRRWKRTKALKSLTRCSEWYGVKADGVSADADTDGLNSMFSDSKGRYCLMQRGTYMINPGEVVIPSGWDGVIDFGNVRTTLIQPATNPNDPNVFLFNFGTNSSQVYGPEIRGGRFYGRGYTCSAIKHYNAAYLNYHKVHIDGFKGSALWLDKCQDSVFSACNIQDSGFSTGDGTINTETTHPMLYLTSSISGDHCNMLRFDNCQIEQAKCSPYVKIDNGIGIKFNTCHMEIRLAEGQGTHDAIWALAGDLEIANPMHDQFRNGVVLGASATLNAHGGRYIGGDVSIASNSTGHVRISNMSIKGMELRANTSQNKRFDNVNFLGAVNISFHTGFTEFDRCVFNGVVTASNVNSGNLGIRFTHCIENADFTINSAVTFVECIDCVSAAGTHTNNSSAGRDIRTRGVVNAPVVTQTNLREYVPFAKKILHLSSVPVAGTYNAGDLIYNTAPVVGGYVGWVYVGGAWKTFGAISS